MTERSVKDGLRIMVVGSESGGVEMLRALLRGRHKIAGIVTTAPCEKYPAGSMLWQQAQKLGVPSYPSKVVKEGAFAEVIRKSEVDALVNIRSPYIICSEVLRAPRRGCFNLHTGPLPEYAGRNVCSWAIYNGEEVHGISVHEMVPEIDAGRTAEIARFQISRNETGISLVLKSIKVGVDAVIRVLASIADGSIDDVLRTQDISRRKYYGREIPQDGWVEFFRGASEVERFVRASCYHPFRSPWGTPRFRAGHEELGLFSANLTGQCAKARCGQVLITPRGGVWIACADQWLEACKVVQRGRIVEASDVIGSGIGQVRGRE